MVGIVIFNIVKDVSAATAALVSGAADVIPLRVILGNGFRELAFVGGDLAILFLGYKNGKEFIDKEEKKQMKLGHEKD